MKKHFSIGKSKNQFHPGELSDKDFHKQTNTLSELKQYSSNNQERIWRTQKQLNSKRELLFKKKGVGQDTFDPTMNQTRQSEEPESIDTEHLEAELSDNSLDSEDAEAIRAKVKIKAELMKTMEDDFKLKPTSTKKQLQSINLDRQRELLKKSKSKFGGRRVCQSVNVIYKTKTSKDSQERKSTTRDKQAKREIISGKRSSKEPPYKPGSRRGRADSNQLRNQNDSYSGVKMSFRKSGSFSKRSRLLQTEEDEEQANRRQKPNFLPKRDDMMRELEMHQTPHWSRVQKGRVIPEGVFNEYYDEIQKKDEEREANANPSEFNSDVKVSDSSSYLNRFDRKDFQVVESSPSGVLQVEANHEEEDFELVDNQSEGSEQDKVSHRERAHRQIKSEGKTQPMEEAEVLHQSNMETRQLQEKFDLIVKEQEEKRLDRDERFEEMAIQFERKDHQMRSCFEKALNLDITDPLQETFNTDIITRKVSDLNIDLNEFGSSNRLEPSLGRGLKNNEYSPEELEAEAKNEHMELLSDNLMSSERKGSVRPREYMHRMSYTRTNPLGDQKFVLDSNISRGVSEGFSLISRSNAKQGSFSKRPVERKKVFLSSSKASHSEYNSSKKKVNINNMTSMEHRQVFAEDIDHIEEASVNKEDISRSENQLQTYALDSKTYEYSMIHDIPEEVEGLGSPNDLRLLIEKLRAKTDRKMEKFKMFYRSSRKFLNLIQTKMHKIYNIYMEEESEVFREIRLASHIEHSKTRNFFKKHEEKVNILLKNFLVMSCNAKVKSTLKVMGILRNKFGEFFPEFIMESFNNKMSYLKNFTASSEVEMEDIDSHIDHFISIFYENFKTYASQKNIVPYNQKISSYSLKAQLKRHALDSKSNVRTVALKNKFTNYFSMKSDVFEQILKVEGRVAD